LIKLPKDSSPNTLVVPVSILRPDTLAEPSCWLVTGWLVGRSLGGLSVSWLPVGQSLVGQSVAGWLVDGCWLVVISQLLFGGSPVAH